MNGIGRVCVCDRTLELKQSDERTSLEAELTSTQVSKACVWYSVPSQLVTVGRALKSELKEAGDMHQTSANQGEDHEQTP